MIDKKLNNIEISCYRCLQLERDLDLARGLVGECFDLLVDIGSEGRLKNLTPGCRTRRGELTDRISALDWIDRA
jgi:hypothetical protein